MNVVLWIIKQLAITVAAVAVLGAAGMFLGSFIARLINPRPNAHLMEGLEYVALGTLSGAGLGLVGSVVWARQSWKKLQLEKSS
jgi:hypothetical protein